MSSRAPVQLSLTPKLVELNSKWVEQLNSPIVDFILTSRPSSAPTNGGGGGIMDVDHIDEQVITQRGCQRDKKLSHNYGYQGEQTERKSHKIENQNVAY